MQARVERGDARTMTSLGHVTVSRLLAARVPLALRPFSSPTTASSSPIALPSAVEGSPPNCTHINSLMPRLRR
jgi:hypothetical protein